jgi:predicted unusual protein kinase regulating ubiquinone biosynthesis (AarF/ABC1/UbiB family)
MAKDWAKLGGDEGKEIDTSRLRRALKFGGIATRVSGSFLKRQIARLGRDTDDLEAVAGAAMDNARHIVEVMGEMKGAAMKIGQILSTDPDLIDPSFAERLATLQRTAPPMSFEMLAAQFERATDKPLTSVFRYFDPTPIGSASIGQVHRGELFDGREVACKIQYPGVADSIESDLKNVASLLKLGRVVMTRERADMFVEEARDTITREADYTIEAENLRRFNQHLSEWKGIRIPQPIEGGVFPSVLMMDFMDGDPFVEAINQRQEPERRDAIATRFVELFAYMFHDLHELHADPHPGNFLLDDDDNIIVLDFGCVRAFDAEQSDNVLRMLRAYWDDDMSRLIELYRVMGFGTEGMDMPSEETMRMYHRIILEPLNHADKFKFSEFQIHGRVREFFKDNLSFFKLVPPANLLLYLRVVGGLKGMMTLVDAGVDLRAIAEACCERRGI